MTTQTHKRTEWLGKGSPAFVGIDPGSEWSAMVNLTRLGNPCYAVFCPNTEMLEKIGSLWPYGKGLLTFAIEYVEARFSGTSGQPIGQTTIDTAMWAGRFFQRASAADLLPLLYFRRDIKKHLLGRTSAGNAEVRQALIDIYGGNDRALRGKKCKRCQGSGKRCIRRLPEVCNDCLGTGWERPPGPLAAMSDHLWSALAVARYSFDNDIPFAAEADDGRYVPAVPPAG